MIQVSGPHTRLNFAKPFLSEHLGSKRKLCNDLQCGAICLVVQGKTTVQLDKNVY